MLTSTLSYRVTQSQSLGLWKCPLLWFRNTGAEERREKGREGCRERQRQGREGGRGKEDREGQREGGREKEKGGGERQSFDYYKR